MNVGDKLWCVCDDRRTMPAWRVVTKVGSKYATLDGRTRVRLDTLEILGAFPGTTDGQAWITEEAYTEAVEAMSAARRLIKSLEKFAFGSRIKPVPFSRHDVQEATARLGLDPEAP